MPHEASDPTHAFGMCDAAWYCHIIPPVVIPFTVMLVSCLRKSLALYILYVFLSSISLSTYLCLITTLETSRQSNKVSFFLYHPQCRSTCFALVMREFKPGFDVRRRIDCVQQQISALRDADRGWVWARMPRHRRHSA